jgi:uncharacterized protein (DUF169 family)
VTQLGSEMAASLSGNLQLAQPPIAVAFVDSAPAGIPAHPSKVPAGCLFWQQAAAGAFVTSAADHALCAVGSFTHNFPLSQAEAGELEQCLTIFNSLGYVQPEDVPMIPVLARRTQYVVYSPLASAPDPPDVVLLLSDASQALLVSEAVQQVERRVPPAMGRPACAIIPYVANSGQAAMSLGCCGARAYVDTFAPHLILSALPGANLAAYVQRIATLAAANATLTRFHHQRAKDIASGAAPTIQQSLNAISGLQQR